MNVWFIRCNGETAHNQPGTPRYVFGEPPVYPQRKFNYLNECLGKGFARVGWPGAGDLRIEGWETRAKNVYGELMKPHHYGYLEQFVNIDVGDIVLMPTYEARYAVYVGLVVPCRKSSPQSNKPYHYYYDIEHGDWFDNAHRIDVDWRTTEYGNRIKQSLPQIGGIWLRGFGPIKSGKEQIINLINL